MKNIFLPPIKSCLKIFLFIFIFFNANLLNASTLKLSENNVDGIYIGKYIEYLSEKVLFDNVSIDWHVDKIFVNKMLSGELHSDNLFNMQIIETSSGYKAFLQSHVNKDKKCVIEWGLPDVLNKNVSKNFISSKKNIFSLNFMPHSYWLRFKLLNKGSNSLNLVLELDKHFFSFIDLFYFNNENNIEAKRNNFLNKLNNRDLPHKNPGFIIPVKPGLNTFYFRVDSWFIDIIPLRLWSENNFKKHINKENAFLGITTGIFLLLIMYNLFIFFLIKDLNYIYLSLAAICQLILHLTYSGFGFQFLWSNSSIFGVYLTLFCLPLSIIFSILFFKSFLKIYLYTPKIDFLLKLFIIFSSILILITTLPFVSKSLLMFVSFILDQIYYLPILLTVFIAIKRENHSAKYILVVLILFFISNLEWIFSHLDIIPYNLVNYLHFKGLSFIIIMSLALTDKFNVLKNSLDDLSSNLEKIIYERTKNLTQEKLKLIKNENKLKKDSELKYNQLQNKLSEVLKTNNKTKKNITESTKENIKTIIEFVKINYYENITREKLALIIDMSPDHFSRMFKQYTGEKISDYINKIRIEEACILLKETNNNIIDIAYDIGFESLRTFNKIFLDLHGKSPTSYRKQYK